jgi:hypothetical protein
VVTGVIRPFETFQKHLVELKNTGLSLIIRTDNRINPIDFGYQKQVNRSECDREAGSTKGKTIRKFYLYILIIWRLTRTTTNPVYGIASLSTGDEIHDLLGAAYHPGTYFHSRISSERQSVTLLA